MTPLLIVREVQKALSNYDRAYETYELRSLVQKDITQVCHSHDVSVIDNIFYKIEREAPRHRVDDGRLVPHKIGGIYCVRLPVYMAKPDRGFLDAPPF